MEKRFLKVTAEAISAEHADGYEWYLDLARPISDTELYMAVQVEENKDPNCFVKCEEMKILYTDQAEYYFVCRSCYFAHFHQQWSGSTRSILNWSQRSVRQRNEHEETKGWCEFCDPIFGNGGWRD